MTPVRILYVCAFVLSVTRLPHLQADTALPPPAIEVPDGFVVETVASPPLVKYPMRCALDERGRLFICESAGLNMLTEGLLENLPNFIRMIEDTDADGKFDKSTIFCDRLTFPTGLLWHQDSLYVASFPNIWRFQDTDDDGVADRREVILGEFNSRGYAGDIHGPFLGPNGRLYIPNAPLGHEIRDKEGQLIHKGRAARIFSCRPDGSDLQTYCGGGMYNPVEVAFTPEGDMFGIMTWYNPHDERRDAFVHYVYGGVYPRNVEASLAEFKRTGPWMPYLIRYGIVAPSSLLRYRGTHFGEEYRGDYFISYFNTHKVDHVQVQRADATFQASNKPFLTSSSRDFRPCDLLEDVDGSLLVVDTGGWFIHGCPSSRIAKPEILGAIYRIKREGGKKEIDPRGDQVDWKPSDRSRWMELLGDSRPFVRDRAITELAGAGEKSIETLRHVVQNAEKALVRRNAVWALSRNSSPGARAPVRLALTDSSESVRLAATHSLFNRPDALALDLLIHRVVTDRPEIRREAAGVLGRLGDTKAVPAILASLRRITDPFLEHALIYALIEINAAEPTRRGLEDPSPQVRRAALIALDQMDGGRLSPEQVAPLLKTDDEALQKTAVEVVCKHADWSGAIVELLDAWLRVEELSEDRRTSLRGALLAYHKDGVVQNLISEALGSPETPTDTRLLVLDVIAGMEIEELPESWIRRLGDNLNAPDSRVVQQTLVTIDTRKLRNYDKELQKLVSDAARSADARLVAACSLARPREALPDEIYGFLASQCRPEVKSVSRMAAARALGSVRLGSKQLSQLTGVVAGAGPLEMPSLIRAFESESDAEMGMKIIKALDQAPGVATLSTDYLKSFLAHYPRQVHVAAEPLIDRLESDSREQESRMAELSDLLVDGDPGRGEAVFFGGQASCWFCHRVGERGGNIGPDLSLIGEARSPRDLLEAIVFPNASIARGFQTIVVVTRSGDVHAGVIRRETIDTIFLRKADRNGVLLRRDEIEVLEPSPLSIMPQGLEKSITTEELRHLIAYLSGLGSGNE